MAKRKFRNKKSRPEYDYTDPEYSELEEEQEYDEEGAYADEEDQEEEEYESEEEEYDYEEDPEESEEVYDVLEEEEPPVVAPAPKTRKPKRAPKPKTRVKAKATKSKESATKVRAKSKSDKKKPKKKKGLGLSWLVGPAILAGLIWGAPLIIAKTDLREPVLTQLIPGYNQDLKVKQATLDWTSPVVLQEVALAPEGKEAVVTIKQIQTEKSLLEMLLKPSELGVIQVQTPVIKTHLTEQGSNVEELLNPVLRKMQSSGSSSGSTNVTLKVTNGKMELYGADQSLQSQIDIQNFKYETNIDNTDESEISCLGTATINGMQSQNSRFGLEGRIASDFSAGNLKWTGNQLQLAAFQRLVERFQSRAVLQGELTSDQLCSWETNGSTRTFSLSGPAEVTNLKLHLPEVMGNEPLELASLKTNGTCKLSPQECLFENMSVESALGRMRVAGQVKLTEKPFSGSWMKQLAELISNDLNLQGYVDLPELAKIFPETLAIQPGLKIIAGQLDWSLMTRDSNGQRVLQSRVGTTDLIAEQNGRTLSWEQPLKLECLMHLEQERPVIDRLTGQSEFMQLQGSGSLDRAEFKLNTDLQRLAYQLSQFTDPGFDSLRGNLSALVRTGLTNGNQWNADSQINIRNFEMVYPNRAPWKENDLAISVSSRGLWEQDRLQQIETANLTVSSGPDQLEGRLAGPMKVGEWPFVVDWTMQGELSNWQNRLSPLKSISPWNLQGHVDLTAKSTYDTEQLQLDQVNVELRQFQAVQPGFNIADSLVRVNANAVINHKTQAVTVEEMTVSSQSVGLRAVNFAVDPQPEGTPLFSGNMAVKADLARISKWFSGSISTTAMDYQGLLKLRLKFDQQQVSAQSVGQLDLENLVIQSRSAQAGSQPLWAEDRLSLSWKTDRQQDDLKLEQFMVDSKLLKVDTQGTVDNLNSTRNINLTGSVDYDLENIFRILQRSAHPAIQMQGRHRKSFALNGPLQTMQVQRNDTEQRFPFGSEEGSDFHNVSLSNEEPSLKGPLSSDQLTGEASFGWDSANIYGLPVGPGDLNMRLEDQVLKIDPLSLSVAEGNINVAPSIRMEGSSPIMEFAPTRLLDNIQLTPELCKDWLGYFAPTLADATEIEGHFGMELSAGKVPLLNPHASDLSGQLEIKEAMLRPGELTSQLATIVKQVQSIVQRRSLGELVSSNNPLITMPEQKSDFRVIDGKVHHKRLTFVVEGAEIHTTGSVGFDESLNLVAEIPIQDKWLGSSPYATSLKGQFVRVPIRGTSKQPQIDRRGLAMFAKQLSTSALKNVLENQLNKQFRNLFGQ